MEIHQQGPISWKSCEGSQQPPPLQYIHLYLPITYSSTLLRRGACKQAKQALHSFASCLASSALSCSLLLSPCPLITKGSVPLLVTVGSPTHVERGLVSTFGEGVEFQLAKQEIWHLDLLACLQCCSSCWKEDIGHGQFTYVHVV